MGKTAKARQAILHCLPGSTEVGRHNVYPDHDHEFHSSPQHTELAFCGQHIDSLSPGRIHLGAVHMVCERKSLLWCDEAAILKNELKALTGSKSLQRGNHGNI